MTYRRRHRWLRRLALGLAFATFAAPAAARYDEGGSGVVTAGGWTGMVDTETGIPLSAGIPRGDEQLAGEQQFEVIPYLSQGTLTEADKTAAAAEAIHDPYLTDVFVRPGESLGGADGAALQSQSVLGEVVKTQQKPETFIPGVTDFPKPTVVEEPQVVNYLSHGLATDGEVGARPDNRADRFAHSDVAAPTELASNGTSTEWNPVLTLGIGLIAVGLALGLGYGFVKRPRIAGL